MFPSFHKVKEHRTHLWFICILPGCSVRETQCCLLLLKVDIKCDQRKKWGYSKMIVIDTSYSFFKTIMNLYYQIWIEMWWSKSLCRKYITDCTICCIYSSFYTQSYFDDHISPNMLEMHRWPFIITLCQLLNGQPSRNYTIISGPKC